MKLKSIQFEKHPLFGNLYLDFINPKTNKPYIIIAFVGENGCGKTTLLNEVYNYKNSSTIVNKSVESNNVLNVLYLKHNSIYNNVINNINVLITGNSIIQNNKNAKNSINSTNTIDVNKLNELGDEQITSLIKNNHLNEIHCGESVTRIIDGNEHTNIIDNFSSGQQEIILKLKEINSMYPQTNIVLIDEPEGSLHPRWQQKIISIITSLIIDNNNEAPQFFIATHSENILESLIKNDDTLIIRLYKESDIIKAEPITQMNLSLPYPTFAELDYIIFHISSFEYHNQLFDYIGGLLKKNSVRQIDLGLKKEIQKLKDINIFEYYKEKKHNNHTYKMLPTYIRNYYHHPNGCTKPSEEELEKSIVILRLLIKYIK